MSKESLLESLKRLESGQILPHDISKLQQALSSKQITYSAGGIAIGGDVSGGFIGNFVLPADVLKMLYPAYQPPPLPPKGALSERGPLPPGHRVPFLPNAVFTGRQEYLTDLADILLHPGKDGAGVAVTGIGGVGKSQLAVEFCYRYGRFFQGVHWIQGNLNISAEVAECGLAMGLPGWPDKLPEQVAATLRAWQEGGRRLIVIDNAEELQLAPGMDAQAELVQAADYLPAG